MHVSPTGLEWSYELHYSVLVAPNWFACSIGAAIFSIVILDAVKRSYVNWAVLIIDDGEP